MLRGWAGVCFYNIMTRAALNGLLSIPNFANGAVHLRRVSFDTAAGPVGAGYYRRAEICREAAGAGAAPAPR